MPGWFRFHVEIPPKMWYDGKEADQVGQKEETR